MDQTTTPDTLNLSRTTLRVLIKLNIVFGVFLVGLLITSVVAEAFVLKAIGPHTLQNRLALLWGMRSVMIVGILAVPLTHRVLKRLLAIVETVGTGNAFAIENAGRLKTIAWTLVGLNLLDLSVGAISALTEAAGQTFDLDWDFQITPWLAVVLLFVLARVFEQGARMREELEGTV